MKDDLMNFFESISSFSLFQASIGTWGRCGNCWCNKTAVPPYLEWNIVVHETASDALQAQLELLVEYQVS